MQSIALEGAVGGDIVPIQLTTSCNRINYCAKHCTEKGVESIALKGAKHCTGGGKHCSLVQSAIGGDIVPI